MRAAIVVESHELTLADITVAAGRAPDSGADLGASTALRTQPSERSSWAIDLGWRAGAHAGTEGLSGAIEGLEKQLANRPALLGQRGCVVVLSVVQELVDDPASTGLHLSAAAVGWLAAAGAAVDIDQYVHQG